MRPATQQEIRDEINSALFSDPANILRRLRQRGIRATHGTVRAALRGAPVSSIMAAAERPTKAEIELGAYSAAGGVHGQWLADVIYLREEAGFNANHSAILTVLNPNSRYAYVRPLTTVKANKFIPAWESILEQNLSDNYYAKIESVLADGGTEFTSVAFKKLMKDKGIYLRFSAPHTHYRLARIDRFHRTLRHLIGKYSIRNNTLRYYDALPEIIDIYNNKAGRVTKKAPADFTIKDERKVQKKDLARVKLADEYAYRTSNEGMGFHVGDRVRVKMKRWDTSRFRKSNRPQWSREVYTIVKKVSANTFEVDAKASESLPNLPKVWAVYDLLYVSPADAALYDAGVRDRQTLVAQRESVNRAAISRRRVEERAVRGLRGAPTNLERAARVRKPPRRFIEDESSSD